MLALHVPIQLPDWLSDFMNSLHMDSQPESLLLQVALKNLGFRGVTDNQVSAIDDARCIPVVVGLRRKQHDSLSF